MFSISPIARPAYLDIFCCDGIVFGPSAELNYRCVTRTKGSRLNSQALSREPLIKFSSVVPPCDPGDPVSMGEEVAEIGKELSSSYCTRTSDYEQRNPHPSEIWLSRKNRTL